jgi:hypothetical protein
LHSKVDPAFVVLNANDAEAEFTVPLGPLVMDVSGAEVSTVQLRVAGVASTLPKESVARTEKVCEPLERPE